MSTAAAFPPRDPGAPAPTTPPGVAAPCTVCGSVGGRGHHGAAQPTRRPGTRYGIPGLICLKCYDRLGSRLRRGYATLGPLPGRRGSERVGLVGATPGERAEIQERYQAEYARKRATPPAEPSGHPARAPRTGRVLIGVDFDQPEQDDTFRWPAW